MKQGLRPITCGLQLGISIATRTQRFSQRGRAATNGTDAINRRQQRQQRITLSVSSVFSCSINSRPFLVSASRLQKRADPPPCLRVPVRDPGPSSVQSEPRRAHSPPHSVWPASQLRAGVELRSRSRAAATAFSRRRQPTGSVPSQSQPRSGDSGRTDSSTTTSSRPAKRAIWRIDSCLSLSPLRGFRSVRTRYRGLTSTARRCRRCAASRCDALRWTDPVSNLTRSMVWKNLRRAHRSEPFIIPRTQTQDWTRFRSNRLPRKSLRKARRIEPFVA